MGVTQAAGWRCLMGVMSEARPLDDEVTQRLWRAHAIELVRFAGVLVGPHDAEDVVMDAVLRSARHADGIDVANRRAYLYRAVANEASNLHRARRRRWERDLSAVGPSVAHGPDPQVDVRRAVATLSIGQRAVVFLVYWGDMTERDAAQLLGLSPGTVRRHLVRARAHLRKALDD